MDCRNRGFTLVELILVIVLVGALGVALFPRFVDLSTSAHKSVVKHTSATFASSVKNVNIAWRVSGFSGPGLNDNVINFGLGNVDVNASGWPTDTSNGNTINGQARCVRVWTGILDPSPSISQLSQSALDTDFKASRAGQTCTYTYQRDSVVRSFTYNATLGSVTSVINP